MKWEPALSVGIDVIDSQHRRIIDYINELEGALHAQNREAVGVVIKLMVDYTITHFSFEEALMEQAGYKLLDEHRRVHEDFTRRIRNYQRRFAAGEDVTRSLMSDLRLWLTNHIKRDDNDYAAAVRASLDTGWVTRALRKFFG